MDKEYLTKMSDMDKEYLTRMANELKKFLPPGHGFILLTFPFGEPKPDNRMHYISNATRESAINNLKEFLIKAGHEEDWMKHIK
jgi:hypothetical protein